MHIATGQGPNETSFEETRIQDYLRAYSTTGRPPAPCPQQPSDDQLRASMGLPPLFKPTPMSLSASTSSAPFQPSPLSLSIQPQPSPLVPAPTLIAPTPSTSSALHEPPAVQWFRPMTESGVVYHNITVQPEFSRFSTEELRVHAYRAGVAYPPQPIPPIPAPAPIPQPLARTDTMAMSLMDVPQAQETPKAYAYDGDAKLLSICTAPQYNQHSFEELRLAYMMHGREMSSAEIFAQSPPAQALVPFGGNPFSSPPPQPGPQNPGGMLLSGPSMARLY